MERGICVLLVSEKGLEWKDIKPSLTPPKGVVIVPGPANFYGACILYDYISKQKMLLPFSKPLPNPPQRGGNRGDAMALRGSIGARCL